MLASDYEFMTATDYRKNNNAANPEIVLPASLKHLQADPLLNDRLKQGMQTAYHDHVASHSNKVVVQLMHLCE